jgi:hypothetical protein
LWHFHLFLYNLRILQLRRYDENFFQAMVTPAGSFMAEVAVTPDTDEVVGAITASMEIENQNEVRGIRGTADRRSIYHGTCIAAVFLMLTRRRPRGGCASTGLRYVAV